MCLAPCFAGCSKEEYDVEVNRLVGFLETGGGSLRATFEQERERASADLDFERAAGIHKKLEKLDDALRAGPEVARRVQDLDAVILQRMAEEQTIGIFGVRGGRLAASFALRFGDTSQPRSAEEAVRDYLEGMMSAPPTMGTPRQSAAELGDVNEWCRGQASAHDCHGRRARRGLSHVRPASGAVTRFARLCAKLAVRRGRDRRRGRCRRDREADRRKKKPTN